MTHVSVLAPVPGTPAALSTNGRERRLLHHLHVTATAPTTLTVTLNGDTTWTIVASAGTLTLPMIETPYRSIEFSTDSACTVVAFTSLRA